MSKETGAARCASSQLGERYHLWKNRGAVTTALVALGMLTLGLALTIFATNLCLDGMRSADKARFHSLTQETISTLKRRIEVHTQGLLATRAALELVDEIDRSDFREMVLRRDLQSNLHGALGIGYIHRVDARVEEFERFLSATTMEEPRFRYKMPPGSRPLEGALTDEHMIIHVIEPIEANLAALGLDIGAEPTRRAAAERAMSTNSVALTGKFELVQARVSGAGFLLLLPVYRHGASIATAEERITACVGWVYSPILGSEVFADVLNTTTPEIQLSVHDGDPSASYGPGDKLIYRSGAYDRSAAYEERVGVDFGGRPWTVWTGSTEHFTRASRGPAWMIFISGTLITCLLTVVVANETRLKRVAVRAAVRMTDDLRRLAMVAEHTTNTVIITDRERKIVWANEGFTQMTGYTLEESLGRKPGDLLQCDRTDPTTIQEMREAVRAFGAFRGEVLNRSKSGREYWLEIDIQPILEHGEVRGFMAIESDITARKRNEAELDKQRHILSTIVESAMSGYWDWDIVNNTEVYSDSWKAMLGYGPDQLEDLPETWQRLIHPDDLEVALRGYAEHVRTHGEYPYHNEVRYRHKDGSEVWVICSGRVIEWDENDQPLRMVGCHVDITSGKRAEAQVREALQRLDAYQTAIDRHSIVAVTDRAGRITEVNELFCEISGYSRDELIGQNHRLLNSGYHPKAFWVEMWRRISQKHTWHGEVCNRTKSGSLYWVDTTITPLTDASGEITGYCVVRTDITRIKQTQIELELARSAADDASRSKSEFLANMSHEIRTPLTAILGYTDLLMAGDHEFSSEESRKGALTTIQRAGNHLLTVINDILDLSKIEAGKFVIEEVCTPLVRVLRDVQELMEPRASEKGVRLELVLETPIPSEVVSDPTRLRQILINLIGNATKFTEEGSITVSARAEDDTLTLSVSDTGSGMTQEQATRLFTPFTQADNSVSRRYGGTGLGLTICRRLASLMSGSIELSATEVGVGSTFTIHLPLIPTERSVPISSLGSIQGVSPGKAELARLDGRILLAEDGIDNQRLITHHLKAAGAEVWIAEDGAQALEMIEAAMGTDEAFHLLITDIQMPVMDGYTLAQTLRKKGIALPIVALTAHAMADDRERCMKAGCDDYATKPVNKADLISTCTRWLTQGSSQRAA